MTKAKRKTFSLSFQFSFIYFSQSHLDFVSLYLVISQNFEIRVIDEFILLGNSAIMKCLIPSFISDFVVVNSWLLIDNNEEMKEISSNENDLGKHFGRKIRNKNK
jgi:hypothetical protein